MADLKDETIERLIKENSFINRMIAEVKIELSEFGDIQGMSFIAAVKKIVTKYKDLVAENTKLKEQIKKLEKLTNKK